MFVFSNVNIIVKNCIKKDNEIESGGEIKLEVIVEVICFGLLIFINL